MGGIGHHMELGRSGLPNGWLAGESVMFPFHGLGWEGGGGGYLTVTLTAHAICQEQASVGVRQSQLCSGLRFARLLGTCVEWFQSRPIQSPLSSGECLVALSRSCLTGRCLFPAAVAGDAVQ